MKFLKGFGASILSFLLLLSLSIFGIAFLLNSTVLNPGFITRQVDSIDISAVTRDVAGKNINEGLPAELSFLKDAIYNVIDAQEPELKKQAGLAINSAYDYLLGKTDQIKITISLDAVKKDLKNSLWQELNKQLAVWLRDNIQSELEPYIEQNLSEYRQSLPAELTSLNDAQLKAYLNTYLKQVQDQITRTGQAPPMSGLLETLIRPYFDKFSDEFTADIPAELVADASNIPADVMVQLRQVKQYIGYFHSIYYALIGFMVLLAAGIFLIYRNIEEPSRALGIDLIICGALDLAGVLVARHFNPLDFIKDLPPSLETWLSGLYNDITGILLTFSIAVLAVGVVLIIVSVVFKKKVVEE